LFVDEVHRFNKAQQDAFLPHIEAGTLVLVGATTENPSFAINAALRSRSRVFELQPLATASAIARCSKQRWRIPNAASAVWTSKSSGRPAPFGGAGERRRTHGLERVGVRGRGVAAGETALTDAGLRAAMAQRIPGLDRGGEEHYNLISALHKSLRGSDPDASLYWLARLLEAGEDPCTSAAVWSVSRPRMSATPIRGRSRSASPPSRPSSASACRRRIWRSLRRRFTSPRRRKATASRAPTRRSGRGARRRRCPVPMHLRNAPTPWLAAMGRAEGYLYPHDFEASLVIRITCRRRSRGVCTMNPRTPVTRRRCPNACKAGASFANV
jgi:putative ATPase